MIHQQQPSYLPPSAAPAPRNGAGTAALVLGILAVVLAWIPFLGFASYALALVGLILGVLGLRRLPRGSAIAGTALSAVGLVSVILATVVYVGLLYAATGGDTSGGGSVPSSQPSVLSTHGGKKTVHAAGIGDKVRDGSLQFTVLSVSHTSRAGDAYFHQDAQGRYTVLTVKIKNVGDEEQTLLDDSQHVYDAKGRKFSADSTADIYASNGNKSTTWFTSINPGNSVHGKIYFDLPEHAKAAKVTFEAPDGGFDGVTVSLR